MRASSRAFLALLCASAGCLGQPPDDDRPGPVEPFGGPTSDWPGRGHDESEEKPEDNDESASDDADPNGEDDTSSEPEPGTKPTPGRGSSGSSKDADRPQSADAGVSRPPTSMSDAGVPNGAGGDLSADGGGLPAGGNDADGGRENVGDADGGREAGSDADGGPEDGGVQVDGGADDGGAFGSCTSDSDRRGFGACYGVYCAMTPGEIADAARVEGACASDLALACDGEIARVVSECAEDNVLALGASRAVSRCAERAGSLSDVSGACLDCYVEEVLCAAASCLSECLSSDAAQGCSDCRLIRCGQAFRACSGLPAPSAR